MDNAQIDRLMTIRVKLERLAADVQEDGAADIAAELREIQEKVETLLRAFVTI